MRLFAGDRIQNIMARFKVPEDQPMEAGILTKQIENAQKKVEEQNFVMRKNVLKYDDVMNKQRTVIYEQRRARARGAGPLGRGAPVDRRDRRASRRPRSPTEEAEGWDLDQLCEAMHTLYGSDVGADELREDFIGLVRPRRRCRRLLARTRRRRTRRRSGSWGRSSYASSSAT